MTLAFILYKYFPFGGLQRDFMRIALECQRRGHDIRVYTLIWEGDVPDGFEVLVAPVRSIFNHRRNEKFTAWVRADLDRRPVQRVIGFNKMPGLDVYYAADACFEEKAQTLRNPLYRQWGRYRHFAGYERAVFDPASKTEILMISEVQQPLFVEHYGTQAERFPSAAAGDQPGSPGAGQRRGRACGIPPRVRPGGGRPAAGADRFRLQDQGPGSQPEGAGRAAQGVAQAYPADRHRPGRSQAVPATDRRPRSQRPGTDPQGSQRYPALPARRRPADPPGLQREHRYGAAGGAGLRPAGVGDRCLRLRPLHRRGRRRAGAA